MEKKEVAVHAGLLETREEGKGKEEMCTARGKLVLGMGLTPRECELLLLRAWKEGPLFPRAGPLRGHSVLYP